MLAIIDARAPKESIENLKSHVDDVFQFESKGLTYNSISGHPDIFIYQDKSNIVVAPNAPFKLLNFLNDHKVSYTFGKKNVAENLIGSVLYNCISTEFCFFHKLGFADPSIVEINRKKEFVNLPQAYTRCSLTHLGNNKFITSDKGIQKKMLEKKLDCFYSPPEQISIIDHKHGFIGGANGVVNNKIFFNGNIDLHAEGLELRNYIENLGVEIISLSNNFLYDGGGIIFIEQ